MYEYRVTTDTKVSNCVFDYQEHIIIKNAGKKFFAPFTHSRAFLLAFSFFILIQI